MRVTMMLADSAQAVAGKLYVLGGGWSITGPEPAPSAIAIKLDVPWDQAEVAHRWTLALVDADGTPVFLPAPDDETAAAAARGRDRGGARRGERAGHPPRLGDGHQHRPAAAPAGPALRVGAQHRRREPARLAPRLQHPPGPDRRMSAVTRARSAGELTLASSSAVASIAEGRERVDEREQPQLARRRGGARTPRARRGAGSGAHSGCHCRLARSRATAAVPAACDGQPVDDRRRATGGRTPARARRRCRARRGRSPAR